MEADAATLNQKTPAAVYSHRLDELDRSQAILGKRERRFGYAKVALAAGTILAAILFIRHAAILELLLVPVVAFILLAILHEKAIRKLRANERAISFYKSGLARIEDRWAGEGETGDRFLDPLHPYARDLDIFGQASLFELLCTVRTRAGEATLAAWLLAAAPVDEIRARQLAVRELTPLLDFRARLHSLGESVRLGVHPEELSAWGERSPILSRPAIRLVTTVLALAWIAAMVAWGIWNAGIIAVAASALNLAWAHRIHSRLDEASDAIEKSAADLELLAGVLSMLEQESLSSPRLQQIQESLKSDGVPPSAAIHKLARIVRQLESRRNPALRLLDVLVFWSAQFVFAAENWRRVHGKHIRGWLAAVGEFEALAALSAFAYEHPENAYPEFAGPHPLFDGKGLAHPLLSAKSAVRNDLKIGDGLQLMVLSGPNMAGKSTFIRCIGINAVLAQCGAPVCASSLHMSPLNVAASICVLDSLSGGISRFYAEIRRLKIAVDLAQGSVPVLFLLDELLSGTNSHDRLAGTELVVRSLIDRGAIGLVTTHDLALAQIPDELGDRAVNCHFEDQFIDGKLIFDFKLKEGIVKTSNALELMRSIGLGRQG